MPLSLYQLNAQTILTQIGTIPDAQIGTVLRASQSLG